MSSDQKETDKNSLFDLENLRMSQDFADNIGLEKLAAKIQEGKPGRQEYFRVHSDPAYRLETAVLRLKDKNETYLVARPLWHELAPEIFRAMLFTVVSRAGVPFIWVVPLPDADGTHHEAHQVKLDTSTKAMTDWMRLSWNKQTKKFDVIRSRAQLSGPNWPEVPFQDLLEIAFKDRFINSLDHPILKELRGEV